MFYKDLNFQQVIQLMTYFMSLRDTDS